MNFRMRSGYKGVAKTVKFIFKILDRIFEFWTRGKAQALYGTRAKYGVILIKTKSGDKPPNSGRP